MRIKSGNSFSGRSLVFKLAFTVLIISLLGGGVALAVFLTTGIQDGLFGSRLCFSNECLNRFMTAFSATGLILQVTWNVLGGVVTIGGIIIALLSYVASAKSSALNNHISHISIFSAYISAEIEKRDRLNQSSFDTLKWYNKVYGSTNIGQLNVAASYLSFISELNRLIEFSNALVAKKEEGGFRYKDHQERIKKHVFHIGVRLSSLPRLDFYEVETQLFELIDTINKSFCHSEGDVLVKRTYL
jgi:hypothetical protein